MSKNNSGSIEKTRNAAMTMVSVEDELLAIRLNPEGRRLLMQFLESEFSVENLLFLEVCDNFEKAVSVGSDDSLKKARELAQIIQENFILTSAPSSINLHHAVRETLLLKMEALKRKSSVVDQEMFKPAKDSIIRMLTHDSFSRFRMTKEYSLIGHLSVSQAQPLSISGS
jgi:hypothetical protein